MTVQCDGREYHIDVDYVQLYSMPEKNLGPSINRLVTDGNTKLCCQGLILALYQSTTANKIDSEHTQDYKITPVYKAEILRVRVKRIEVFSSFYVDF